ncbi:4-aminobutyrate aminotransferase, partial [Klebsiella oxytoca]
LMQQHHDKLENNEAAKQPTQVYRNKMGIAFLSSVAQTIREQQFDNPPSYLTVKLAAEQSLRLALLREHTGMGRYDLLDGLQSAFIKGSLYDSQNELWDEIKTCFSGYLLG